MLTHNVLTHDVLTHLQWANHSSFGGDDSGLHIHPGILRGHEAREHYRKTKYSGRKNSEVKLDFLNQDKSTSGSVLTNRKEDCPKQSCSSSLLGFKVFEIIGLSLVAFNFMVHSGKITRWCATTFVKHRTEVTEKQERTTLYRGAGIGFD